MKSGNKWIAAILLSATALCTPQFASAATSREADLAARLEKLEAEMSQLRADLAAARSEQAQTASTAQTAATAAQTATTTAETAVTKSDAATAKVAALESKPLPDGFKVGATTFKIGGYIKLVANSTHYSDGAPANNSFLRDFYVPQQIPTGNQPGTTTQDFSAKQTRLWLGADTNVGGHSVKGYLEVDFQTSPGTQGSQRTTNGYNLTLRRGFIQFDRWTIGQDWSSFQYVAALPETTDFVGPTEGAVFVREPLIRYSVPLNKHTTLHISAENPESGTLTAGNPALVENGTDHIPDFAARLAYSGKIGELSLAGVGRQIRVHDAATGVAATASGFGVSAGGKLFLSTDKVSDLRFMVTYGQNIGRFVGLNFGPDAVYVPGSNKLENADIFAAFGALRVGIVPGVRVNLIGGYQNVDYSDALTLAQVGAFNKRAWSGSANIFYSPYKPIDLGIEYRHGERELVNGASGELDRVEVAAKYTF